MQAFVAVERSGTWGTPAEMPRPDAAFHNAGSRVLSVSCVPAGPCTGGGYYADTTGYTEGLVVNQTR